MPTAKLPRDEVVARIADVFRRHGFDGTSLTLIAEATGLGRASLYHYFPDGKEQMGREVFAHVGAQVERDLLAPLDGSGEPRAKLRGWARGVGRFYEGGAKNCLLGTMVLGGGQDLYARHIEATFERLVSALAIVLREAGQRPAEAKRRALRAVALIQGTLVTARGLGDDALFRTMLRDLPDELLSPAVQGP